jgi:hypothetical protein
MKFDRIGFGRICIDGTEYLHDVVIDRGEVRARKKGPSKKYRHFYGHAPLSSKEKIPWRCKRLVIGTGAEGRLPIMGEVRREAVQRGVELLALPTEAAVAFLGAKRGNKTNAILHVTC